MSVALKRVLLFALCVVLFVLIGVYFGLIAPTYKPHDCSYTLDLEELRKLATQIPGDKPKEIRVERTTDAQFPKAVACAGESWESVKFSVYAYQLVFEDKTIVIDTAMNRAQSEDIGMTDDYDEQAWQRVAAALPKAQAIYVTHEHSDHMGGAFTSDAWAANIHLNPLQLDSTIQNRPPISAAARTQVKTLKYERYLAVAPGVVLIEALGHTPGSQMVYVSRADGTEVIFTGDTAWIMDNVTKEQGPAKLVPIIIGSDRVRNSCQLAALNRVRESVVLMPGHDNARMAELLAKGVFVKGFQ